MPPPPQAAPEGATVFSKLKMGATMGGAVGLTIGFLFGSFAILKGFLPSLSGYMLSSAATFAFFMSIGSVIRTDGLSMAEWAQREVAQGRMGVLHSAGGNGGSVMALAREWERRKGERS